MTWKVCFGTGLGRKWRGNRARVASPMVVQDGVVGRRMGKGEEKGEEMLPSKYWKRRSVQDASLGGSTFGGARYCRVWEDDVLESERKGNPNMILVVGKGRVWKHCDNFRQLLCIIPYFLQINLFLTYFIWSIFAHPGLLFLLSSLLPSASILTPILLSSPLHIFQIHLPFYFKFV